MTKEEYKAAIKAAETEHKKRCFELAKQYAAAHRIASIGDKVTDGEKSIIVDKIGINYSWTEGFPYDVYGGVRLKKDGNPVKNGSREALANSGNIKNLSN